MYTSNKKLPLSGDILIFMSCRYIPFSLKNLDRLIKRFSQSFSAFQEAKQNHRRYERVMNNVILVVLMHFFLKNYCAIGCIYSCFVV